MKSGGGRAKFGERFRFSNFPTFYQHSADVENVARYSRSHGMTPHHRQGQKRMHLEHVNMTVCDLEESIAFYRELLRGEVSWRGQAINMTKTVPAAHVRIDGAYISMFEREDGERAVYDYGPPGINHIGFVIDDLAATRARLAALGVTIEKEADYEPGVRLYIFDPNGIELELVSYEKDAKPRI